VLDVLKIHGRHSPIVLLQPSPRLQDVFPLMDLSDTVKLNHQLPNLDSAYVGVLEETGSLFAMSSDHFPLVAFGDASPNSIHPLIDPPPGTPLPTGVIHKSVDEITKARKLRELCDNGSLDPRCLIGIRKLELSSRSRSSRLLDAAPVIQIPQSTTSAFPVPSKIEGLGDNKSLVNLLPPWPSTQTPGQNLQSNLPWWLLVPLSTVIGWILIGRRGRKSTKHHDPSQSSNVQHEGEERAALVSAIGPQQPPDRFDGPEASDIPTVDGDAPIEEVVAQEETVELGKGDPMATRKKPLRRRRGKKKKGPNLTTTADTDEPEGEAETDAAFDPAEEESGNIQLVLPTRATAAAPSPALILSDEILGMLRLLCSPSASDHSPRFWFPRNRGFQGHTAGPCRRRQTASSGFCHLGHPRSQRP
jgi:serine/threonine-protein kinase/endoribonuclease IRE1